jgi:hypothetical protein
MEQNPAALGERRPKADYLLWWPFFQVKRTDRKMVRKSADPASKAVENQTQILRLGLLFLLEYSEERTGD